jgi:DNA-binding XRE family transcriptional regulator
MEKEELLTIREQLGKTQSQLAELLGVSHKAVQSFEQGWRNIPVHIERQVLFLLAMKRDGNKKMRPCWVIEKCPKATRQKCPAWEFKSGHFCWFINGTICHGEVQANWHDKMKMCRKCKVLQAVLSTVQ